MQRSLKVLSVLTTIILMFVLLGGALVTKTDSGQGCGASWPLCNGQLVPNAFSMATLIELSHRLVSGTAGIFVTVLSVWSWRKLGHVKEIKILSVISFIFLMIQALFGAAAVVWAQSSFVLALHFGVSLISFAAVVQLTLLIFEVDKKFDAHSMRIDSTMRFHIYGITLYSYLVVYTGALVRHTHANYACPDFPLCTNKNIGLNTLQEWVQMGHRLATFLLVIWIIVALIHALRFYKGNILLYWGWIIASILVTLQAITGILNVYITTSEPLFLPLSHGFIISCLFSLFCYLSLLTSRSKK